MTFAIALSDEQWVMVAELFDPPGRRGAPAAIPRRQMVDAMRFIGRTGCQWRYLPERYGTWTAVWAQWRRWPLNGLWAAAMTRLAAIVRVLHEHEPVPSMVMVDAQTVKGGRYGPTFHQAGGPGGRTIGTKRTLLVEILGLPVAAGGCSPRPHDVVAARELLRTRLPDLPRLRAIVGDRADRGLAKLAERKHVRLEVKATPVGTSGFIPIWPLYKVEHTIAQLGRWRRLSRCREGTETSATAWLEVSPRSATSPGASWPDRGCAHRLPAVTLALRAGRQADPPPGPLRPSLAARRLRRAAGAPPHNSRFPPATKNAGTAMTA
jgi:transposase